MGSTAAWSEPPCVCPAAAAAVKSLQSCLTLCDPIDGSPPGPAGVGCHFLLQCMKVKSESEVSQLCPTCSDPMDCSLPGSSIPGIFQAQVLESGAIVAPWTVACQAPLSMELPRHEYWSGLPFPPLGGSFLPRDETCVSYVSCIGRWVLYH